MLIQNSLNDCESAQQLFLSKTFVGWKGLPGDCDLDSWLKKFDQVIDGEGQNHLGIKIAFFKNVTFKTYEFPITIWTDHLTVLMLDVKYPNLPDKEILLKALGNPNAKLSAYWGTILLEESEWVFSERGITLLINPESEIILWMAVYPSISLNEYETNFRQSLRNFYIKK